MVTEQQANNLSKGPIGKALFYAKNQLPLLEPYLLDGRIQIDNNLIKNAIRPLALSRKNYLFAGSHKGAEYAAMMYSLFASCKTMEVNPWSGSGMYYNVFRSIRLIVSKSCYRIIGKRSRLR